jgi:hypothetical protein
MGGMEEWRAIHVQTASTLPFPQHTDTRVSLAESETTGFNSVESFMNGMQGHVGAVNQGSPLNKPTFLSPEGFFIGSRMLGLISL